MREVPFKLSELHGSSGERVHNLRIEQVPATRNLCGLVHDQRVLPFPTTKLSSLRQFMPDLLRAGRFGVHRLQDWGHLCLKEVRLSELPHHEVPECSHKPVRELSCRLFSVSVAVRGVVHKLHDVVFPDERGVPAKLPSIVLQRRSHAVLSELPYFVQGL